MQTIINRGRTAIRRTRHSRPIDLALSEGLIGKNTSVFDYGCGRGDDISRLNRRGFQASGWDPNYRGRSRFIFTFEPGCKGGLALAQAYDVVNLGFVLNVIEDPADRKNALLKAWKMTKKVLLVAVRTATPESGKALQKEGVARAGWKKHGDGVITSIGTFQKFYHQCEFQKYLEDTLKQEVIMAAPGIAYVFRAKSLERLYLALRYPRPEHGPKTAPKRGKERTND
ncbi:MAG: DNA phosphorothioation-associated putative methyltransferase [Veillonellaceae bacterium]|nr:DNA phosphorothioation-associated putative methyltransferase [Veillonellaceae bacterium]